MEAPQQPQPGAAQQSATPRRQRIAALLNQIPPSERQHFERYYQERLATALQEANARAQGSAVGSADPDEVERALLNKLAREADGLDDADGLGDVPGPNRVYGIVPPKSDPRARAQRARSSGGQSSSDMTPQRWAALIGIVLLTLVGGAWWLWPSQAVNEATAANTPTPWNNLVTPTPLADISVGSKVQVIDPASLEFVREAGEADVYRVVASASQLGGSWTPDVPPGTAAWLEGTTINSIFCLPPDEQAFVKEVERGQTVIMRTASGAVRRYEIMRVRTAGRQQVEVMDQRRAGMTIMLCSVDGNTRTVIEAIYRPDTVQQARQATNTPVALADLARIEVQAIEALPPTPDLPPGIMPVSISVVVANLSDAPLAWTDLVDQLEIGGAVAEAVAHDTWQPLGATEQRTVLYRYLVPSSGGQATWRITAATGESTSIALSIPPSPGTQAPSFVATLDAAGVQLQRDTLGRTRLAITLQLSATEQPVTVGADAFALWSGTNPLPLQIETPLPLVIQPDTPQNVTVVGEAAAYNGPLVVHAGDYRWRVELP